MGKRLLFAAARGARIYSKLNDGPWIKAYAVVKPGAVAGLQQRIHPDDAHLEYGPISTALRGVALTDDCEDYVAPYIIFEIERETGYWPSTNDQRCVFLLILAEALADEGL